MAGIMLSHAQGQTRCSGCQIEFKYNLISQLNFRANFQATRQCCLILLSCNLIAYRHLCLFLDAKQEQLAARREL